MALAGIGAVAVVVWFAGVRSGDEGDGRGRGGGGGPAPVQVAAVERGPIALRRTFSGTLEASARFVVAPKVGGRLLRLAVDLADPVRRGQVVAELDGAELEQDVARARAELAVARANLAEARSGLEIADRALKRARTLRERGVASEMQLDAAIAEQLAGRAAVEVARARLERAEAELEAARIRLGYTTVAALWAGGSDERVVAERFVDEGDMVAANAPLLSIVELDPITAVIHATERDYARLRPGQRVELTTDAHPGEVFAGEVARIAPVFDTASRQARVEVTVPNPGHRLKPGMFVRARAVLERVDEATIVPVAALVTRDGRRAVFVVSPDGATVSLRPVEVGIRDEGRVQVTGDGIEGRVVVLGQQLLGDGSAIAIPRGNGAGAPREARAE